MGWEAGDLDDLARDMARDGAADVEHFKAEAERADRLAAADRERRFRLLRDDLWQRMGALLLGAPPLSQRTTLEAIRLARAAERVDVWRRDASRRAGWGGV